MVNAPPPNYTEVKHFLAEHRSKKNKLRFVFDSFSMFNFDKHDTRTGHCLEDLRSLFSFSEKFLDKKFTKLKVISPPRGVPGLNRQSPLGRLYGSSSRSSSSSSSSASADIDMDLFSTNLVNHNLHAYLESTVKNFCLVNNVFAQSGGLTSKRSLALFFELFWKEYFALVKTTCKNVMKPRQEVDVSQLFRNVQSNATRGGDLPIWPEFTKMRVGDSIRNVNSLEYKFQHLLPLVPSGYRNKTTISKYVSCPGYEKFGARWVG